MPRQKPGKSKQTYRTPKGFLSAVMKRLEITKFAIDLAASKSNAVTRRFYSKQQNALVRSWVFSGWNWLNPPFGKLKPWAAKAFKESKRGAHTAMLVPAAIGSNWWRDFVHGKARVLLLNGRITFVGQTTPYPKDCVLLLFGPNEIPGYEVWTWPNEMRRKEPTGPTDLESVAFNRELHIEPASCTIELRVDEAGAECVAAGLLPPYLKDQARDCLALRNQREQRSA